MRTYEPRPLPAEKAEAAWNRLARAHAERPFSATDPREGARRVTRIVGDLGLTAVVCRGVVGLGGVEVDHLWVDVEGRVVDAAFPLLSERFTDLLRYFVAGDLSAAALADAAAGEQFDARVIGVFPDSYRYFGAPVWRSRFSEGESGGMKLTAGGSTGTGNG